MDYQEDIFVQSLQYTYVHGKSEKAKKRSSFKTFLIGSK